jgi:O-antigen ligase
VIAERPFTGRCHGSFADAFRMMRNVEARQDVVITHNSDLELALEIEVPPAVLLVLVFAALFLRCVTSVRVRGRDVVVGVVQS